MILKIKWQRDIFRKSKTEGFMELNLERFFPCTIHDGKIVFELVRDWSSVTERSKVRDFLNDKISECEKAKNGVTPRYNQIQIEHDEKQRCAITDGMNYWVNGEAVDKEQYKNYLSSVERTFQSTRKALMAEMKSHLALGEKYKKNLSLFDKIVSGVD